MTAWLPFTTPSLRRTGRPMVCPLHLMTSATCRLCSISRRRTFCSQTRILNRSRLSASSKPFARVTRKGVASLFQNGVLNHILTPEYILHFTKQARLSNCGKSLKPNVPNVTARYTWRMRKQSGMVKSVQDIWVIRSQVLYLL